MKFQINVQATMINSNLVSDSDLRRILKLGKNEGVAFNVSALGQAIAEQLAARLVQVARRSKGENLTVAIPLKVEGNFLAKVDLSQAATTTAKRTDEEKRSALLTDLGL